MANYPATVPVATVEELSRAYKLERLVAPYAVTVTELSDDTLRAAIALEVARVQERALRAPNVTRSPLTGHVLGGIYYSRYWHDYYTVKAIDERGFVTVRWHGRVEGNFTHRAITTHCTNVGRDELVGAIGSWS